MYVSSVLNGSTDIEGVSWFWKSDDGHKVSESAIWLTKHVLLYIHDGGRGNSGPVEDER